ncbi:MAG TPA: hypothetical protein PLO92_00010 [Anaerolineaceae bacterium]|jgi:hypothetical protein|nr:hypothetical protein [Anaerolineaceae bacterium]HQC20200.1 hypothetical protein [Anaerolineaceae bacterium]
MNKRSVKNNSIFPIIYSGMEIFFSELPYSNFPFLPVGWIAPLTRASTNAYQIDLVIGGGWLIK